MSLQRFKWFAYFMLPFPIYFEDIVFLVKYKQWLFINFQFRLFRWGSLNKFPKIWIAESFLLTTNSWIPTLPGGKKKLEKEICISARNKTLELWGSHFSTIHFLFCAQMKIGRHLCLEFMMFEKLRLMTRKKIGKSKIIYVGCGWFIRRKNFLVISLAIYEKCRLSQWAASQNPYFRFCVKMMESKYWSHITHAGTYKRTTWVRMLHSLLENVKQNGNFKVARLSVL